MRLKQLFVFASVFGFINAQKISKENHCCTVPGFLSNNSDLVEMVMLNGRLYEAKTMNEVITGYSKRLPHWWEE